ncbi:MAG: hypothetical protein AB7J32_03115 [Pseudonocardia sp.]
MKMLIAWVAVLVALAGCTPDPSPVSPVSPADERLVAEAVTRASGRTVPLRCLDQEGLAAEFGEETSDGFVVDGQVLYDDETGLPTSLQLADVHCAALAAYSRDPGLRAAPDEAVATALATLGHEYSHFVDDTDEAQAECHSFQYAAVLAPGFGADAAQAGVARAAVVALFGPLDAQDRADLGEYVVGPECVDGGAYDLDAPGSAFPPVGTTSVD